MEDKKREADPLANPAFRRPGILENLREAFLGVQRPLHCAQIEVTSACMGKCCYCPHTSQASAWRTRHMQRATFARLWPLLRVSRRAHLQGWGEPLLNPHFFDYVKFASKAGCHVSTTTSGLIMNADIADKLIESGLELVAFSLAGTDQQSNAARMNVDFEKVCANIALLRERLTARNSEMEIHLAYIMLADRMDAARELPRLINRLGIDCTVVSTLDYLATDADRDLGFAPDESEKITHAGQILHEVAEQTAKLGRKLHYALPAVKAEAHHQYGCRENVTRTLYIDAEGNVSPCVYLNVPGSDTQERRKVFGNVLEEDPLAIWNKKEFVNFRQKLAKKMPDAVCQGCPKRLELAAGS